MATNRNINDPVLTKVTDFTSAVNRLYSSKNSSTEDGYILTKELIDYILTLAVLLTGETDQEIEGNLKITGQATGGSFTKTFAAGASFDLDNGNSQKMTLTANVTSLALTNKVNGGSYLIYLVQDVTGGWTIPVPGATFGGKTNNSADFLTGANDVNIINVNVDVDGITYYTIETYTP